VVADAVNALKIARDGWRDVAARASVRMVEVEVVCSDAAEHRRRVEARSADIPGLRLPTWQDVLARPYEAYDRPRIVVDTASDGVDKLVDALVAAL
jgi:hypothetical protein